MAKHTAPKPDGPAGEDLKRLNAAQAAHADKLELQRLTRSHFVVRKLVAERDALRAKVAELAKRKEK